MTTTTSRRAVLAGIVTVPATSLPALASEPDPIFALIERHRAAIQAHTDAMERVFAFERPGAKAIDLVIEHFTAAVERGEMKLERWPDYPELRQETQIRMMAAEVVRKERPDLFVDSPAELAAEEEGRALWHAAEDLAAVLVSTPPTTLGGVAALLAYFAELAARRDGSDFPDTLEDDDGTERPFAYFIARSASRALATLA